MGVNRISYSVQNSFLFIFDFFLQNHRDHNNEPYKCLHTLAYLLSMNACNLIAARVKYEHI